MSTFALRHVSAGNAPGRRAAVPAIPWFAIAALTAGVSGTVVFVEGRQPPFAEVASAPSVHASIVAALLLAQAAVLYVVDGVARRTRLGRAASLSAAVGAAALIAASLVRWIESEWMTAPGSLRYAGHYEVLTWIAALGVFACLAIEHVYRSRIAGCLIMPLVALVLGACAWLMAGSPTVDPAFGALIERYLAQSLRLATWVGAASFAVAGAIAWSRHVRHRPAQPARRSPGDVNVGARVRLRDAAAFWFALAGFCALALALIFDAARLLLFHVQATAVERAGATLVLALGFCVLLPVGPFGWGSSASLMRRVARLLALLGAAYLVGQVTCRP